MSGKTLFYILLHCLDFDAVKHDHKCQGKKPGVWLLPDQFQRHSHMPQVPLQRYFHLLPLKSQERRFITQHRVYLYRKYLRCTDFCPHLKSPSAKDTGLAHFVNTQIRPLPAILDIFKIGYFSTRKFRQESQDITSVTQLEKEGKAKSAALIKYQNCVRIR